MPPNPSEFDPAAAALCFNRQYELVKFLGDGTFKRAYLIKVGGQFAALKLALKSFGGERLQRETFALRDCDHPNVVKIQAAFDFPHGGQDFWVIIEEFLDGGTLAIKRSKAPLHGADIRHIGQRLADVLAHFYPRKIVHRDIKPENILFKGAGIEPVLTDFGVARLLGANSLTMDFSPMGPCTPAYASPEQLNNDKALIDWRTDQFGLALVLSECLLGYHAYQQPGMSLDDAIRSVAARVPIPVPTTHSLASLGFGAILRALEPWPVARFRLPEDFCHALTLT
jgi:eukaryotic-like serine/threonine-protein kinase